jgi:chromosome segregation ATPase
MEQINPEGAEKIFADSVSERMVSIKLQMDGLKTKQDELLRIASGLVEQIKRIEIETATYEDSDAPLAKHSAGEIRQKITEVNSELELLLTSYAQITNNLEETDIRMRSLEATLPGNELKN